MQGSNLNNPYKPPQSHVADRIDIISSGPRPAAVKRACLVLWAAWAMGVISLIPGIRIGYWDDNGAPLWVMLVLLVAVEGLVAWLIVLIHGGRNWARWTYVSFMGVAWLLVMADQTTLRMQGMVATAIDLASLALNVYASILLLWGEGATWYRKPRAPVHA